jgi:hypothetical protein
MFFLLLLGKQLKARGRKKRSDGGAVRTRIIIHSRSVDEMIIYSPFLLSDDGTKKKNKGEEISFDIHKNCVFISVLRMEPRTRFEGKKRRFIVALLCFNISAAWHRHSRE